MDYSHVEYRNTCYYLKDNELESFLEEACKNHVCSISVLPFYVSKVKELLTSTCIPVSSLIGYPFGGETSAVLEYSSIVSMENHCDEVLFVLNHSAIRDKNYGYIQKEIETIRDAVDGRDVRAIIYPEILSDDEILKVVEICNTTFIHGLEISFTHFDSLLSCVYSILEQKSPVLSLVVSGNFDKEQVIQLLDCGVERVVIEQDLIN